MTGDDVDDVDVRRALVWQRTKVVVDDVLRQVTHVAALPVERPPGVILPEFVQHLEHELVGALGDARVAGGLDARQQQVGGIGGGHFAHDARRVRRNGQAMSRCRVRRPGAGPRIRPGPRVKSGRSIHRARRGTAVGPHPPVISARRDRRGEHAGGARRNVRQHRAQPAVVVILRLDGIVRHAAAADRGTPPQQHRVVGVDRGLERNRHAGHDALREHGIRRSGAESLGIPCIQPDEVGAVGQGGQRIRPRRGYLSQRGSGYHVCQTERGTGLQHVVGRDATSGRGIPRQGHQAATDGRHKAGRCQWCRIADGEHHLVRRGASGGPHNR